MTCYLRENGPIAYELDLFGPSPRDRAEAMIASDLAWAWRSPARDWTELTRVSLSAFLADVGAGDVLLVGTDHDAPHTFDNGMVKAWLRKFSRLQASPLAAAIATRNGRQFLYVQQQAADSVNRLLDAWALDKRSADRRAYARLGAESLESIADGL